MLAWRAAMTSNTKLNNLSDIYSYFRKSEEPVFFVHPTPYNVLGLGPWALGKTFQIHYPF